MSTVCEVFGTQVHLVRKVRFDSINEFDSEVPWLLQGSSDQTEKNSFTFRARIGIDTGVNSTSLFNMIAHISYTAKDSFVSFRFFRPAHVNGMKKYTSQEYVQDGFSSVNLSMTFLKQDGTEKFSRVFHSKMDTCGVDCSCSADNRNDPCHRVESFCPVDWILDSTCKNILPSGTVFAHLFAVFDIRLTGRVNSPYWSSTLDPLQCIYSLSNTMKKILENSTMFDVTLKVDGQEFQAHMNVLAGHSDVFAAMFDADMMERNQKTVEIPDLSSETMTILLKYLYCRELREIFESAQVAVDLLRAADKYNIKDLQRTCEEILESIPPDRFSVSAALDTFLCGHLLQLPSLELLGAKVLKSKPEKVRVCESFQEFVKININIVPHLFYLLLTVPI